MNLESTKKNILTAKKVYDKRNEYPVDCEFTLPDYCPDIERILKCNITSRISGISPADISVLLIYLEQLKAKKE